MLLKHQVEAAIRIGCRVVVISNPFWFWPWLDLHPESVEQCVQERLEVREKTRDTEDETVFVLHSHPDVFAQRPTIFQRTC